MESTGDPGFDALHALLTDEPPEGLVDRRTRSNRLDGPCVSLGDRVAGILGDLTVGRP